jgi:hypothetical protein
VVRTDTDRPHSPFDSFGGRWALLVRGTAARRLLSERCFGIALGDAGARPDEVTKPQGGRPIFGLAQVRVFKTLERQRQSLRQRRTAEKAQEGRAEARHFHEGSSEGRKDQESIGCTAP